MNEGKGPLNKDVTVTTDEDLLAEGLGCPEVDPEYINRDNGEKLNFDLIAFVCNPSSTVILV